MPRRRAPFTTLLKGWLGEAPPPSLKLMPTHHHFSNFVVLRAVWVQGAPQWARGGGVPDNKARISCSRGWEMFSANMMTTSSPICLKTGTEETRSSQLWRKSTTTTLFTLINTPRQRKWWTKWAREGIEHIDWTAWLHLDGFRVLWKGPLTMNTPLYNSLNVLQCRRLSKIHTSKHKLFLSTRLSKLDWWGWGFQLVHLV